MLTFHGALMSPILAQAGHAEVQLLSPTAQPVPGLHTELTLGTPGWHGWLLLFPLLLPVSFSFIPSLSLQGWKHPGTQALVPPCCHSKPK